MGSPIFARFCVSDNYSIADIRLNGKKHVIEVPNPGCDADIFWGIYHQAKSLDPDVDIDCVIADCSPEEAAMADIDVPVIALEPLRYCGTGSIDSILREFDGLRSSQEMADYVEHNEPPYVPGEDDVDWENMCCWGG